MRIIVPCRTCRGREASRRGASIGRCLAREARARSCASPLGDVASSVRLARLACKSCTSPTLVVANSCLLLARRIILRTQVKWDGAPSAQPAGREPARYRSEARFGLADSGRHLRAAQMMRVTTAIEGSSRARTRRAKDHLENCAALQRRRSEVLSPRSARFVETCRTHRPHPAGYVARWCLCAARRAEHGGAHDGA